MTEKQLDKLIKKELDKMERNGDVLWHTRLISARIGNVTHNEAGTPDRIAVLPGPIVLFIELKSKPTDYHGLRYEQREFFTKHHMHEGINCHIIWSVDQLKQLVRSYQ